MDDDERLQFLDEATEVALEELLACSGLAREEVLALVEIGVFSPRGASEAVWRFSARVVWQARSAARLRNDFGLDSAGMALALTYLERIENLERRLRELECQLPR